MTGRDLLETILVLLLIAYVAVWTLGGNPEGTELGPDGTDVIVRYAD